MLLDALKSKPESEYMDKKRAANNNKIWSDIITVQLGGIITQLVTFWLVFSLFLLIYLFVL